MTVYLYAAYGATWAIVAAYAITLSLRSAKLRQEWDEFRAAGNRQ